MSDPNEPESDLTLEQVRELAAALRQRDLDIWASDVPPIPTHLPPPEEVARRVLARAGVADPDRLDVVRHAITAAVAEADLLPPYERPATVGEMARWVKTRLHGHAPLPPEQMTAFLLAFAAAELRRPPGEAVNDWSRLATDSLRSTVLASTGGADGGGLPAHIDALLAADRPAGEALLLCEFAGQTPDAVATLTGRAADAVRRDLADAKHWVAEELRLAGLIGLK